jgi:hypothetical protein
MNTSAAGQRHAEQQRPQRQHQADLEETDEDVGQDLADHQLHRPHRRRDEQLEVAALALADDGHRGEQHHGHGEDDADQAGDDEHRRAPLRVVERQHLEGRRRRRRRGPGAPRQRQGDETRGGSQGGRVGGVDEELGGGAVDLDRCVAAEVEDAALEVRRHHDADGDAPLAQQVLELGHRPYPGDDVDHLAGLGVGEELAGALGAGEVCHPGAQVADVLVDAVAEEDQL